MGMLVYLVYMYAYIYIYIVSDVNLLGDNINTIKTAQL
jgi:hypothetical protein